MLNQDKLNADLLAYLDASPTPFHAVSAMVCQLDDAGFQALEESESWDLQPGGRYYVVRNGSTLLAFVYGRRELLDSGWRMLGAHTDSPCLKLKPEPDIGSQGYLQLGVEVYGGALLNPWFDRDLSLAGRVNYLDGQGALRDILLDMRRPVAVIPSLAIHLDREANNSRSVNAQKDIPPLLLINGEAPAAGAFRQLLRDELIANYGADVAEVLDFELSLYDTQGAALVGWRGEFVASARLDNLLSCHVGLQALLAADGEQHCVLICNDHEEVGSMSAVGAQGPMLRSVLERIAGSGERLSRSMTRSMMISLDNAHAIHPNFADRHDSNHGPKINAGPVIKLNANQRYASNSETSSLFRKLCREVEAPVQSFVVRTDMACGSTIGPITAAELGIRTLDVGLPTFAMHSIRELAGSEDAHHLYRAAARFLNLTAV